MDNIINFPAKDIGNSYDITFLATSPMWAIRDAVRLSINCDSGRQVFTRVIMIVVRALAKGKMASNGKRTEVLGLTTDAARQRIVDLLDLVMEVDAQGQTLPTGGA